MHYGVGVVPARPYKPRDKAKVESGVLSGRTLDHRRAAASEVLLNRGTEPSDPRAARPHQPATVPQARRLQSDAVRGSGQACDESAARRAFRPERMVPRPSQHRLSHRLRHELLQRALQPGARTGGSALDADDRRDLPQESARGVTPARTRPWARRHHCRAPSTLPPGASGMDAVADGALGQTIGPHTARLFERILADKPHPEMGYRSCLGIIRLADQYSPARVEAAAERALLTGACRYQSVKSILKNSLDVTPLEHSAAVIATTSARQHPWRGVLRVRRRPC